MSLLNEFITTPRNFADSTFSIVLPSIVSKLKSVKFIIYHRRLARQICSSSPHLTVSS